MPCGLRGVLSERAGEKKYNKPVYEKIRSSMLFQQGVSTFAVLGRHETPPILITPRTVVWLQHQAIWKV